jgi:hypothetical protein
MPSSQQNQNPPAQYSIIEANNRPLSRGTNQRVGIVGRSNMANQQKLPINTGVVRDRSEP